MTKFLTDCQHNRLMKKNPAKIKVSQIEAVLMRRSAHWKKSGIFTKRHAVCKMLQNLLSVCVHEKSRKWIIMVNW